VAGKIHQLQIRVTAAEKAAIQRAAAVAGLDMSRWALARLLPAQPQRFRELTEALRNQAQRRYALADLNDFLERLTANEFTEAVCDRLPDGLDAYVASYVAAMVETAAHRKSVAPPAWAEGIPPLDEPVFGTPLESLRLHLLIASPPAFRRRKIFIDATVGDRV
jgi:hypothetical protein